MKHLVGCTAASFAALLFFACSATPKGDPVRIGDAEKVPAATGQAYVVDTGRSRIHFVGSGVGQRHPGAFRLSAGTLTVGSNGAVSGGDFTIDIQSLSLDEPGKAIREKLRPHLLGPDFFDAEKFGTARFVLTRVVPYRSTGRDTSIVQDANYSVSGNLTLKETTRNVTFPARVNVAGGVLQAEAHLNIDRTQWNMNYHSDKSLKDKFISETVNVRLDLRALAR